MRRHILKLIALRANNSYLYEAFFALYTDRSDCTDALTSDFSHLTLRDMTINPPPSLPPVLTDLCDDGVNGGDNAQKIIHVTPLLTDLCYDGVNGGDGQSIAS